ncbi:hypothetical protein M407DRAFT_18933 [Tulasnella calospora MUT 4182]|uniref:DRBM domain-containing protein n=1 Tax=Tulasnella calospora MUT 4182 TaxID=1051891 RepID=A0A0C3LDW0_9AGAM|nr:hypothetical protein M407DRAFT_18933 [Tulasnella calospora MUT 4182]
MTKTKEYMSILHNLKQKGIVHYIEQTTEKRGKDHEPTWDCWIEVKKLLHVSLDPESQGQCYWHSARTKGEARNEAARLVLYAIQYYERGLVDVPRAGFPVYG